MDDGVGMILINKKFNTLVAVNWKREVVICNIMFWVRFKYAKHVSKKKNPFSSKNPKIPENSKSILLDSNLVDSGGGSKYIKKCARHFFNQNYALNYVAIFQKIKSQ